MIAAKRIGWIALLAASLAGPGCASLRPGAAVEPEPPDSAMVRPDAPPEYDLLVAQQLTLEGRTEEAVEAYQRAVAKDPDSAYLHRRVATVLARSNRLEEALHHATRAVELEPDDVPSRIFLAQIHRVRRNTEVAEEVLVDEFGDPVSNDAAYVLYQVYLDAERYEDALAVAEWLTREEPDSLRGLQAQANVYLRMDRPLEAEARLREALERDPGNLRIYGLLARSLRLRGAHSEETELYAEILERYPRHHATLVALGEAQMALDDLQGAISTFEIIEERYPEDLQSVMRLGYLAFEARDFAGAARRFERVLEADPENHEVAFFLGVVRLRAGDSDAALEVFRSIPRDHRHYSEARAQMAAIFDRRGQYQRALEEVKRAASADPSRELSLYSATLRAKAGDLEGAVAHLEGLLEEAPGDDELLFNLGVVYGEADQTERAIDYMLQALEKNPDNASALNYIGYTWAERGIRLDEAQKMIERAIELRPEDGYIVDSLGWVYYMRARPLVESGRLSEARGYIERALEQLERADELTGGDPVISEHLGDTYLLLDQKERALEMFEEAIRLEPRRGEQPDLMEKFEKLRRELR